MAYEEQKARLAQLIEQETGIHRTWNESLEAEADQRAYEGFLQVGIGPNEDGVHEGITHPSQDELEARLGPEWTDMGVGEIAIWGYLLRDPVDYAFKGWMASTQHAAVLRNPKYKHQGLGVFTHLPQGAVEFARRWYFIDLVSINVPEDDMADRFTDVDESNPFYNDIEWMAEHGLSGGTGDGSTFSPKQTVTREQMAAFMHRLHDDMENHN